MKVLTDELGTAVFTKSAHDHDAVLKPWEEPADGGDLELALGLLRDARDRPALAADDNARHVLRHPSVTLAASAAAMIAAIKVSSSSLGGAGRR